MTDATTLPAELRLEQVGERRFRAPMEEAPDEAHRNVVFGGQILAQMIAASHLLAPDKEVKSISAIYARAARYELPLEYEVESMQAGRAFASDTVTLWQDGKLMSRALILLNVDEPDLIRHATVAKPAVPGPEGCPAGQVGLCFPGTEQRVVGGVDFSGAFAPRDPAVCSWVRTAGLAGPLAAHQGALAWASNGALIGTAMLPHAEIDLTQAHRTISTGPLNHTVNFHERFDAGQWLLLVQESIWAGRGRTHGRGLVYTEDGRLVASFSQDNMVRHVPGGGTTADPNRSM